MNIRVLLVLPDGNVNKLRFGPLVRSAREAPLTMTTLAALAPEDLDCSFRLVDESIGQVPVGREADLVAISVMTGTAVRAYEIAGHYRDRGVPVVLGGVHATLMPDEAARHADAVAVGPAEDTWPRILRDFAGGHMRPRYDGAGRSGELPGIPAPRRELQRARGYLVPDALMATRGCRHTCDFCAVPAVFPYFAKRPIADVVRDVRTMRSRFFIVNDVSLTDDVEYAKELFRALTPLKKRWAGLATVAVADDDELLDLMRDSGCQGLLIGFESIAEPSLAEIHKGFNRSRDYQGVVDAMHERRMSVQGTFMFGFDHDDIDVFDATVERVCRLGIDIPRYSILTPYPGTPMFERLAREGRILSYHWADYDTMHVVCAPARMSAYELYAGFKRAYSETFRMRRILARARPLQFRGIVNFLGNLTYRRFAARLLREPRYAHPFTAGYEEPPPEVLSLIEAKGAAACRG
jgi:radical SAM superfamily enzyme YgiQ (UPF0313 family)